MNRSDNATAGKNESVSIREFKAHLGRCLDRVEEGKSLIIENRGEPIADVSPPAEMDERTRGLMERLRSAGIEWNGKRIRLPGFVAHVKHGSVSELVHEEREEGIARW